MKVEESTPKPQETTPPVSSPEPPSSLYDQYAVLDGIGPRRLRTRRWRSPQAKALVYFDAIWSELVKTCCPKKGRKGPGERNRRLRSPGGTD